MQSEMQRPQQQQAPRRTDEQTVTFEAPSAPQEDHTNAFNPDSIAIETYLSSLGLSDKIYMPNVEKTQPSQQQQQQTPLIQAKKEPQKIIQNIPQLVPNNNNYASATTVTPTLSTSPNNTTTMSPPGLQPIMYTPQQMLLPQQQQQQQPQMQPQQMQQQQMQQQQQMLQVRPSIAAVSKESMQLDQLQLSVATLSNQMQQVVKSLGNLDERLTSLETKIDTVILKQRTLEDISRDNNRLIQNVPSKPVAPTQPVTAEVLYGIPPSNFNQSQPTMNYPSNTGPYNIPMGTPIQAQSTPTQYSTVPSNQYNPTTNTGVTYSSPPQNTRPQPPTVTSVRPSNPPSTNTGSLYPGVQSVQSTQPPKPAQGARVTVKFDERLINDALSMGFDRTMIVDTLYELYGAGQPANDINLLVDKLSAKVGR